MGEVQPSRRAWREQGAAHSAPLHKIPGTSCDFQTGFGQVRSGQVSTGLAKATEWTAGLFPGQISCRFCKLWTCREDKHWAIVPKVCHPFLSFAQRTRGEEDGTEKVKDPYGFRLAEDIPSSEVSCGKTEVIDRHTGLNSVAFMPTRRAIFSALD